MEIFEWIFLFITPTIVQGNAEKLPELSCGEHQVFSNCGKCIKTCSDPNPKCTSECLTGCFCMDGYVMAPDGSCVTLRNCPREKCGQSCKDRKAEMTFGSIEQSIDECQSDEVFVWCGWCESTCSEPHPVCQNSTCTRGCLCRPPLLRHHSGHCVEEKFCLPQKCSSPNEEYSCRYGCELRCVRQACMRPRRCRLGCHCKRGLYRNVHGECVDADKCFV